MDKNLKILLSGQLITSRIETLEKYLRARINFLGVIGITSAFSPKNVSRCTLYEKGAKISEFSLPSFQVGNMIWYKQPLLAVSFFMYFIIIIFAALRLQKKFDIFVGVACFSTFVGIILKKLKVIRHLFYYSIDYYSMPKKFSFNTLMVYLFRYLDKMCVRYSDITWHITPAIAEGRFKFSKVPPKTYKHMTVPLTYDSTLFHFQPLEKCERYTIGFVGCLSENQGLQLLVKVMPEIIKEIPQIRIRVIGKGYYERELKAQVRDAGLKNYFIFHGFIKEESGVLDILSKCALGIAPYTSDKDSNVLYADSGKPKLYAFCGLPVIITNGMPAAWEIEEKKAGFVINYDAEE
ncbi:MAG: glycosyltransferase, partial [Candidatus Omnitrophota bacterium]|nr:glycosyltransferase [Candidatus Omnitrophota bacterium]